MSQIRSRYEKWILSIEGVVAVGEGRGEDDKPILRVFVSDDPTGVKRKVGSRIHVPFEVRKIGSLGR